ncbi:hypothetical protein PUNSTDRAFT_138555 [Punctularia strigosozonata HHB-11173 SS5]|uniref:Uncharacterized protein n=1 Tax=Punctularia strigosozonata (strain HHB-11173) TaxID=741275 RepID=R7S2S2_PUNST|nr:uncharacterized protein PUNSTDRAFT_138555 [Punctularia strigosozonata HHB-11173 SS5]EIN04513.1 hypothetical protein PUNSTDRAFT_138555 [Punctularia strigosozonata HHB-11173 SS5]
MPAIETITLLPKITSKVAAEHVKDASTLVFYMHRATITTLRLMPPILDRMGRPVTVEQVVNLYQTLDISLPLETLIQQVVDEHASTYHNVPAVLDVALNLQQDSAQGISNDHVNAAGGTFTLLTQSYKD